jgi:hypothetical protein
MTSSSPPTASSSRSDTHQYILTLSIYISTYQHTYRPIDTHIEA